MLKLNLASGTDIRDGWVNLDVVPKWPTAPRGCDIIWDARKDIIPFGDNSADAIYAGYLLLHLAPKDHPFVLSEMKRVLAPYGHLMIGEVDMEVVMRRYIEDPTNQRLSELIWGEQGVVHSPTVSRTSEDLEPYDKHCQGFTEYSLVETLKMAGFTEFQRVKIHSSEVFYELTVTCKKVV